MEIVAEREERESRRRDSPALITALAGLPALGEMLLQMPGGKEANQDAILSFNITIRICHGHKLYPELDG